MLSKEFTYIINSTKDWPPSRRPNPPFGPTAIEILRSCPLRACFDASPGYTRRITSPARIGMAFHETLESLYEYPLPEESELAAAETIERFEQRIRQQEAESANNPREAHIPYDVSRADRALDSLLMEMDRITSSGIVGTQITNKETVSATNKVSTWEDDEIQFPVEVEIPVQSLDGLFRGRVDVAEKTRDGTVLYDYKSALRDDLPERYERQLQLYAFLWNDTRGEWPQGAFVLYPLTNNSHRVNVDPVICEEVALESKTIVENVERQKNYTSLATPGDVCKVCDYRPWCSPFWSWQASESKRSIVLERSYLGFSGNISQLKLDNFFWHITIDWAFGPVNLIAPLERFPHLKKANVGHEVRILDTPLGGLRHAPTAKVNDYSEIFLLEE